MWCELKLMMLLHTMFDDVTNQILGFYLDVYYNIIVQYVENNNLKCLNLQGVELLKKQVEENNSDEDEQDGGESEEERLDVDMEDSDASEEDTNDTASENPWTRPSKCYI